MCVQDFSFMYSHTFRALQLVIPLEENPPIPGTNPLPPQNPGWRKNKAKFLKSLFLLYFLSLLVREVQSWNAVKSSNSQTFPKRWALLNNLSDVKSGGLNAASSWDWQRNLRVVGRDPWFSEFSTFSPHKGQDFLKVENWGIRTQICKWVWFLCLSPCNKYYPGAHVFRFHSFYKCVLHEECGDADEICNLSEKLTMQIRVTCIMNGLMGWVKCRGNFGMCKDMQVHDNFMYFYVRTHWQS